MENLYAYEVEQAESFLSRVFANNLGIYVAHLIRVRQMQADLAREGSRLTGEQHANNERIDESFVRNIYGRSFIHGQGLSPQRDLNIGSRGNGRQNGCGPIAAYNALLELYNRGLTDHQPNIAAIIRDMDAMGGFINGGRMGTNPDVLRIFIRRELDFGNSELYTNIDFLPANLNQSIRNSYVSILLYIGDIRTGYVHYVMIRHAGWQTVGGQNRCLGFEVFNLRGQDTTYYPIQSVDVWAWGLSGLTDEEGGNAPLALITISN